MPPSAEARRKALDDFFESAREDDVETLDAVLGNDSVKVDDRDRHGHAATHHAAALGSERALKSLIMRKGADADAEDDDGRTALHHAAANGRDACVRCLIDECEAWMDVCDGRDETPLIAACRQGDATTVETLLARGAETNARNVDGCDAFVEAVCVRGDVEIGKLLIKAGVDPKRARVRCGAGGANVSRSALNVACALGRYGAVKFLIDECGLEASGSDCADIDYMTPLMSAAMMGEGDVVEYLLLSGAAATAHLTSEDGLTAADMLPDNSELHEVKRKLQNAAAKAMQSPRARSFIAAPRDDVPRKWSTGKNGGGSRADPLEVRMRSWIQAGVDKYEGVPRNVRETLEKHAVLTKEIELRSFLLGLIEDDQFQEDMQDPSVRGAVDDVINDFHNVTKYRDNARIMHVLTKFRHVQRFCKDRGEKITFDDILAPDEAKLERHRERLSELKAAAGVLWDDALLALKIFTTGEDMEALAKSSFPVMSTWKRTKLLFSDMLESQGAHAFVSLSIFAIALYYYWALGGFRRKQWENIAVT